MEPSMLPSGSHQTAQPEASRSIGKLSLEMSVPHTETSKASSHQTNPPVDLSKHPSGIVPQLQNVVSTCYLGRRLDLKFIAMHARNAEYNPKRFAAVIMRIREPKTTALIFSSGKMVCTGAKSESDSRLAARKFARTLQKLGFSDAKFQDFKVQNIVGSCDARFPIRLEGLHFKHGLFSSYEPELFPGLIYRMKKPKVVLLIFVSGKVVLTGAKHRAQIYQAFEAIYPALTEFRKGEPLHMPCVPSFPGIINSQHVEDSATNNPNSIAQSAAARAMKARGSKSRGPAAGEIPENHIGDLPQNSSMDISYPPLTPGYAIPPPTPGYGGIPPPTPGYAPFQDPTSQTMLIP